MPEERKPRMSIEEVEAVLVDLPDEQLDDLLDRVMSHRETLEDEIHPAILERARRTMSDIRSGRANTVPADDVLDQPGGNAGEAAVAEVLADAMRIPVDARADLADRLILSLAGDEGYDPAWVAEMNRRMDEIQSGGARTIPAEDLFAKLRTRRHARSLSR